MAFAHDISRGGRKPLFHHSRDLSILQQHSSSRCPFSLGILFALSPVFRGKQTVLRISIVGDSEQSVRLVLEGRLVGPWVNELRKQTEEPLSEVKKVTLDLGKVWFVDPSGAALLRELADRQVEQVNCSIFISQQLKETTL